MKYFLQSFSSLPLNHSRRVIVSYKRKYVHKVLVNRLFKLAQEKVWIGELTIAVALDLKQLNKQTNKQKDIQIQNVIGNGSSMGCIHLHQQDIPEDMPHSLQSIKDFISN